MDTTQVQRKTRTPAIDRFLTLGATPSVIPSGSFATLLSEWEQRSDALFEVRQRLGTCYESERPALLELEEKALAALKQCYDYPRFTKQEALKLLFYKLSPNVLAERDARSLPFLFPISILKSSERVTASFEMGQDKHKMTVFAPVLSLPEHWPLLLRRQYSDLLKGLMTYDEEQEYNWRKGGRPLPTVELEVEFHSVIPKSAHRTIERAISLAGRENVFVVVDCTGVKPKQRLEIAPNMDPVVIAVAGTEIFHIADFDTTSAEAELMFSTPTNSPASITPTEN